MFADFQIQGFHDVCYAQDGQDPASQWLNIYQDELSIIFHHFFLTKSTDDLSDFKDRSNVEELIPSCLGLEWNPRRAPFFMFFFQGGTAHAPEKRWTCTWGDVSSKIWFTDLVADVQFGWLPAETRWGQLCHNFEGRKLRLNRMMMAFFEEGAQWRISFVLGVDSMYTLCPYSWHRNSIEFPVLC